MKRGTLLLLGATLGAMLPMLATAAEHSHARATSALPPIRVFGLRQVDLVGAGHPDETILECSCVTAHDRFLIFDPAGDMPTTTAWRKATNLTHDTWVMDIGARGRASLIVQFSTKNGEQVARLYDDVNGNDGSVAYHLQGAQVVVDESQFWTMQVTSKLGWFLPSGKPNLNLSVLMDKPFINAFDFVDRAVADGFMHHDGRPDIAFDEVANPRTGIAEYSVTRLLAAIPAKYQIGRSRLWSNAGGERSRVPDSALFWPFLSFRPPEKQVNIVLRAFDFVPQIEMNWQNAAIQGITLPGYPARDGYFINNQSAIDLGKVNNISYEAPAAWYDIAHSNGPNPSVELRSFTPLSIKWQEIRYSWIQYDPSKLIWDYKVGMLGDPPNDLRVVNFQNFSVRMVPYNLLPDWIFSQTWKLNTFVAREGGKQVSSEGIYLWSPLAGVNQIDLKNPTIATQNAAEAYLSGASADTPAPFFNAITAGYRGEYNLSRPMKSILYYSPVDRRLHLKGAEHGLLNLGNGGSVVYDNNTDGNYLDQWVVMQGAQQQRALYKAGSYLTFSSGSGIEIKRAGAPDALFESPPPRNHQEWATLGARIKRGGVPMAPAALASMFSQFSGPILHIPGATVQDFRRAGANSFHFEFSVARATRVSGGGLAPNRTLAPGTYTVNYNGMFRFAVTHAGSLSASVRAESLMQYRAGTVVVSLQNASLLDVPSARLELWAVAPGRRSRIIASQSIALTAKTTVTTALQWTPLSAGTWTITPRIVGAGSIKLELHSSKSIVGAVTVPATSTLLSSTSVPSGTGFVALGLAVLVLLGAAVWGQQIRTGNGS
jgi:hypothetical protein